MWIRIRSDPHSFGSVDPDPGPGYKRKKNKSLTSLFFLFRRKRNRNALPIIKEIKLKYLKKTGTNFNDFSLPLTCTFLTGLGLAEPGPCAGLDLAEFSGVIEKSENRNKTGGNIANKNPQHWSRDDLGLLYLV